MRLLILLLFVAPAVANGAHDHAASTFDSGLLDPGQTWSHTFTEVGMFAYHCHPHPWMQGSVEVLPANGSAPAEHTVRIVEGADSQSWGYEPPELVVRAGDTVQWSNDGQAPHTVTSLEASEEDSPGPPMALVALLFVVLAIARRR